MQVLVRAIRFVLMAALAFGMVGASRAATGPNPLENGDFEQGAPGAWDFCGGARIVDAQAVGPAAAKSGRYALRLGQPIDNTCLNDALGPSQVAFEDVTIPSDASDVSISFWYSVTGTWAAGDVSIGLTRKPRTYIGNEVFIGTIETDEVTSGWHLYRTNLKPAEVAAVRGKTLYLHFYARFQGQPSWNWAMHLDDVRVTPGLERTPAAPLPAALSGDGQRPLVVFGPGATPNKTAVQRMDTNGKNRIILAEDALSPRLMTWSPDGTRIAYATDWLEPENNTDNTRFQALTARVYVMNADGGNLRAIHKTLGRQGKKDNPPGCVGRNDCPSFEAQGEDALDGLLTDLVWAPDGQSLAITYCSRARWYNSDKPSRDALCHVSINPIPAAPAITTIGANVSITSSQVGSWSPAGNVLFAGGGGLGGRAGIWERNLQAQPPVDTKLADWLTESGSLPDLRGNAYTHPIWAPDGRRFVTVRQSRSSHFVPAPATDLAGGLRVNYEIMLHERASSGVPRMLLLTDHGQLRGRPAWSPNGNYLLYTLANDSNTATDIWWLDVATGQTGRVTNDGVSSGAHWRPTARLARPNLTSRVHLPFVSAAAGGTGPGTATATPPAGATPFSYVTVTPIPTATPLPTPVNPTAVPPRDISGRVTYLGAPVAGINIHLERCNFDDSCVQLMASTTNANGEFVFTPVASTSGIFSLRPTYRNGAAGANPDDPRFLQVWQAGGQLGHDYGERRPEYAFDIADAAALSPANNASVPVPATFQWSSRGHAGETYLWRIETPGYDLFNNCDQPGSGSIGVTFTLASLDCSFLNPLPTGVQFAWQVLVQRSGQFPGTGLSRPRIVTFAP